ncbi:MAG: UDP-galactopyranose mutase [Lachnospiraceae bacterium]|nr:UDP-galactopyranose mutase [Lachnospiraceae bacterium]
MNYDYVIVGAGLAGLTFARIKADEGKKILVVERRSHIGGNVYDSYNNDGILIHNYGPHIFHTKDKEVYEFLSRFTEWNDFQHRVLSFVDGNLIPMPITLENVNKLYNLNMSTEEMKGFIAKKAEKIDEIKSSRDVALSMAGQEIYEKFFENYTKKQWGVDPKDLDTSVISRIPLRYNRDTRYFTDQYQGMPKFGYTKMCESMIASKNIKIMLNTDFEEIREDIPESAQIIYTGAADAYYGYKYGRLKYRSLKFKFETYRMEEYQEAPVVNYPNDYDYTRITEFKKMTWQKSDVTTIVKEFPCDYDPDDPEADEPYYPFPTKEWKDKFALYKADMDKEKRVHFIGRLAQYRYYNMDAVVRTAIDLAKEV